MNLSLRPSIICVLVVTALATGACTSLNFKRHAPQEHTAHRGVWVYWVQPNPLNGPAKQTHLSVLESTDQLNQEIQAQRLQGFELIDFDAQIKEELSAYLGVWALDTRQHVLEHGLTWSKFEARHATWSQKQHELVEFTVYQDLEMPRVAAIWRPSVDEPKAATLRVDLSWQDLLATDQALRQSQGLYLEQVEVYGGHLLPAQVGKSQDIEISPQVIDRRYAGVWRRGTRQTRLLRGQCENFDAQETTIDLPLSDTATGNECSLISQLAELVEKGFRTVDVENTRDIDTSNYPGEVLVLLHSHLCLDRLSAQRNLVREGSFRHPDGCGDWLLFEVEESEVNERDQKLHLHAQAKGQAHLEIRDADLGATGIHEHDPHVYHDGLAHDAGTTGWP